MILIEGKVISVENNKANVEVKCGENCDHCGACSASKKVVKVNNQINAKVGNNVVLEILNFKNKIISMLCYAMPIIITFIFAISFMNYVDNLILCIICLFCFIFMCFCGIIISSKLLKNTQIKIKEIKGDNYGKHKSFKN